MHMYVYIKYTYIYIYINETYMYIYIYSIPAGDWDRVGGLELQPPHGNEAKLSHCSMAIIEGDPMLIFPFLWPDIP